MEEEKKKREFHAKPVPKSVGGCGTVESKLNQSKMSRSIDSVNSVEEHKFKARPASVVHKKPFIPKKEDHQITVCEFSLSTEYRAKKREEYEKNMKEKEEEMEKLRQMYKEEQEKKEKLRIAQQRKETVHKANPVRHYKPLEINHTTKKLTSPHSPTFISRRKNETR